jgi:hypothetical protein
MSFKKNTAIVALAVALAAISVPAMAFENELHGVSNLRYYMSNYETGSNGNPLSPAASGYIALSPGNSTQNLKMNNYFEQRSRFFYTAKASDDLKLVTGFEIDSAFGDRAQSQTTPSATNTNVPNASSGQSNTGRNQGGALESDTVNLETKWVYLDFLIPSTTTRVSAGIQPFKDQLKGIFLDADIAGVLANSTFGPASIKTGYLRAYDQSYFTVGNTPENRPRGMDNLEVGVVEGKFAVSKDASLGAVYYLYNDNRGMPISSVNTNDIMIHTLGLIGDFKVGDLSLSGFAAYQGGVFKGFKNSGSAYLNAVAANVALKLPVGPGTFRTAMLFTSGNDNDASTGQSRHLTGWVGTAQSQNNSWTANGSGTNTYNESGMMLLNRNSAANTSTTDYSLVYNSGNGTSIATMQGLYLYTLGYDAKITPKLYANANLGFAWAAHTNTLKPRDFATGGRNATNFMGTEINIETGYKMYDNLTASLSAAYVILGGFYEGSSSYQTGGSHTPEDPYTIRTSLKFSF